MDVYAKPEVIDEDAVANLGPLAPLAGVWEGDRGVDVSPCRDGSIETAFRERLTLEPMGPVVNGPQVLYALRYATTAWPIGEDDAFHEEVGYWLWDANARQVMRYFIVPRGVTVAAGGEAAPDDTEIVLRAEVGSEVFGITSNPFLDVAFKTVRYELRIGIDTAGASPVFGYAEDTVLQIAGSDELFHHTDQNTLHKVG